jgi:radical SAM protein with 4Fe4S-binding SPASM domain
MKIIPITLDTKQRITNSVKLLESWIPELPSIYQIEVMSRCNFKCQFCQTGIRDTPYSGDAYIDDALFKTIVERDLGGSSFIELQFRGEPTLNKHLNEYVKLLRKKVFVGFSTHGNLLHQEYALKAALNSHYVTISIDAGTPELYEQYRLGGNWERLILNINLLLDYRGISFFPVIDFQFIEFDGFEDQIEEFKTVARHLNWMYKNTDQFYLSPKSTRIRTVKDTQANTPNRRFTELCTNPWYSVSIKANGAVVPCCMAFNDEPDMVYGNLHEQSLKDIWNSDKVKEFRIKHREDHDAKKLKLGFLPMTCQTCYARSPHNLHQNILNEILKLKVLQ